MVLKKYELKLIPAGTKGVTRGNKFNEIVKEKILDIALNDENYEIEFEKKHPTITTDEIPDWYIHNKKTGKTIIGMNQLDLWNGGAQTNRGYKYIIDNKINSRKVKFLCVVCNHKKISKKGTKVYNIFNIGFKSDTLCYVKNLEKIINNFIF